MTSPGGANLSLLAEIAAALALVKPGRHQLWANIAKSHVLVLHELGEHETALAQADQHVEAAQSNLGYVPEHLRLAQCLVRARAGHAEAAAISEYSRRGAALPSRNSFSQ